MTGLSDTLQEVNGDHRYRNQGHNGHGGGRMTNADVQGLAVENQLIGVFPKEIVNFFPNILIISFIGAGFTTLTSTHLQPFPNIVALRVDNNNIEQLNNDMLVHNPKLKTFIFQGNNMKRIGAKLVNRFASLRILRLNDNTCVSGESYNDPSSLNNLLYNVGVSCAPTFETMEVDLLNSPTFLASMDARIKLQVDTCVKLDSFATAMGKIQGCVSGCTINF